MAKIAFGDFRGVCRMRLRWAAGKKRGFCRLGTITGPSVPRTLLCAVASAAVAACSGGKKDNPDWVIHSKLVFMTADWGGMRPPLPLSQFRMVFPYIAGDLYGSPTTGDFFSPTLRADYSFDIDLNRAEKPLLASLEPTEFSLSYLKITPAGAHVARLAPMALQADGIDQVGRTNWLDSATKEPLLLLFLDRAANISGQTVAQGRPLRYDIRSGAPGYVWVARRTNTEGATYTVIPRPARLVLAITPLP
jgi:hypothetical protein